MAHHVEPMDIDSIENDFDNKENSFHHNVLPSTEKGYEELDVSELNMKLRYSITPVSSPMSKSCTANCLDNRNSGDELANTIVIDNGNLTRSLNSNIIKNDTVVKSLKVSPLQSLPTDTLVDGNRNATVLRELDTTITKDIANVTVKVSEVSDADENLSFPSSSSSTVHTPEATTPTKELPKNDGSPIMRGLKNVLNMFRSSQSPIPSTDGEKVMKQDEEERGNLAISSTPIANKNKESIRTSPYKESIVFNDDLEKELQWKDETTIIFSEERIPIHKLFFQHSKTPVVSKQSIGNPSSKSDNTGENLNATVEYMDISYNDSLIKDRTMTGQTEDNRIEVTATESDGEFVDCETTFTKNDLEVLENQQINVTEISKSDNTQNLDLPKAIPIDSDFSKAIESVVSNEKKDALNKSMNTENIENVTDTKDVSEMKEENNSLFKNIDDLSKLEHQMCNQIESIEVKPQQDYGEFNIPVADEIKQLEDIVISPVCNDTLSVHEVDCHECTAMKDSSHITTICDKIPQIGEGTDMSSQVLKNILKDELPIDVPLPDDYDSDKEINISIDDVNQANIEPCDVTMELLENIKATINTLQTDISNTNDINIFEPKEVEDQEKITTVLSSTAILSEIESITLEEDEIRDVKLVENGLINDTTVTELDKIDLNKSKSYNVPFLEYENNAELQDLPDIITEIMPTHVQHNSNVLNIENLHDINLMPNVIDPKGDKISKDVPVYDTCYTTEIIPRNIIINDTAVSNDSIEENANVASEAINKEIIYKEYSELEQNYKVKIDADLLRPAVNESFAIDQSLTCEEVINENAKVVNNASLEKKNIAHEAGEMLNTVVCLEVDTKLDTNLTDVLAPPVSDSIPADIILPCNEIITENVEKINVAPESAQIDLFNKKCRNTDNSVEENLVIADENVVIDASFEEKLSITPKIVQTDITPDVTAEEDTSFNGASCELSVENTDEKITKVAEKLQIYENNRPLTLLESKDIAPEPDKNIEEIDNPFISENTLPDSHPTSPAIISKGYNFNFDEIVDPFTTKTKIRISPTPDIPNTPCLNSEDIKSKQIKICNKYKNRHTRKSLAEIKKLTVIKPKLNSTFDSTPLHPVNATIDEKDHVHSHNIEYGSKMEDFAEVKHEVDGENIVASSTISSMEKIQADFKDNQDLSVVIEQHQPKSDKDVNIQAEIKICDSTTVPGQDGLINSKINDFNKSITISSEIKNTSSSEHSTYYSAGTSSNESIQNKNVFNLPEIDDINFNPFASKSKVRQSPLPSFETDEQFPVKINNRNSSASSVVENNETITDMPKQVLSDDKMETEPMEKESSVNMSNTTCSSKATDDKDNTVREVNTEDEDTAEGPFLETEDLDNLDKLSDANGDMMQFCDLPTQENSDNLEAGELFIDADAFEFLLNQNKSNIASDHGKESLFLKFDPLFAKRISSDGIVAALSKVQKRQSTPTKFTTRKDKLQDKSPLPGPSTLNSTYDSDIHNIKEDTSEDLNVTVSKPMMVVTPAVNSVMTPRNKSSTPSRTNRRSITFASPAIAVIDRLLSMSGNNSPVQMNDPTIPYASRRQNEADLALTQLRELLAEKEIQVYNLRSESKDLRDRLSNLESHMGSLEAEGEERLKKINDLTDRLSEKNKIGKSMAAVVEEYEWTIASLIAETEQDKKRHAEERMVLIKERDEQTAHLASMEVSFSDLHSKYEKSKQIIQTCKANEEVYKKSIKEFEDNLIKMQTNYELLKQHATSKLNHANQEFEKINRAHETEVLKLNAMIKRKEMHIVSLEESLTQKTKANEELTAICDELINKVG